MTMTIADYVKWYFEQTDYTEATPGLFWPTLSLASMSGTVFGQTLATRYRDVMRYMYSDVVLNFDVDGMDFQTLYNKIGSKLHAAASMKIGKWELMLKAITEAAGLTADDLKTDYLKTITREGSEKDQNGGTVTVGGTEKRNSFNSSELVDTAGSSVTTTDTTSKTHSFLDRVDTESGNMRPKIEAIKAFYDSAEVMDFVGQVVSFFMIQVGSMVY